MKGNVDVRYKADGSFDSYTTSGLSDANQTSTAFVHKMKEEMLISTEKANRIAEEVDSTFGGANVVDDKPKATAKSSQTASTAIPTTKKARHATDVGKYAGSKQDK